MAKAAEFGGWSVTEPVFVVTIKKDAYINFLSSLHHAFNYFAFERNKQIEAWKTDQLALEKQADRAIDRIIANKFMARFYDYQHSLTRKVKWGFWKRLFSGNAFAEVTETIREDPVYKTALEFAIGSRFDEYSALRKSLEPDGSQPLWEAVVYLEQYDNSSNPIANLHKEKAEYMERSIARVRNVTDAEFTISRKAYDAMADIVMVANRREVPHFIPNYEWLHD